MAATNSFKISVWKFYYLTDSNWISWDDFSVIYTMMERMQHMQVFVYKNEVSVHTCFQFFSNLCSHVFKHVSFFPSLLHTPHKHHSQLSVSTKVCISVNEVSSYPATSPPWAPCPLYLGCHCISFPRMASDEEGTQ